MSDKPSRTGQTATQAVERQPTCRGCGQPLPPGIAPKRSRLLALIRAHWLKILITAVTLTTTVLEVFVLRPSPLSAVFTEVRLDLPPGASLTIEPDILDSASDVKSGDDPVGLGKLESLWFTAAQNAGCRSLQITYSGKNAPSRLKIFPRAEHGQDCAADFGVLPLGAGKVLAAKRPALLTVELAHEPQGPFTTDQVVRCISGTALSGEGPALDGAGFLATHELRVCGSGLTIQSLRPSNDGNQGDLKAVLVFDRTPQITIDGHDTSWWRRWKLVQLVVGKLHG